MIEEEHVDPNDRVHQSDPALVRSCLAGDDAAWEELVDRYGRLVYAIPRRMGLSEADVQDVFQNVFVTLLRHLGNLRDQTRLSAWLITTTRRESWRLGREGGAACRIRAGRDDRRRRGLRARRRRALGAGASRSPGHASP